MSDGSQPISTYSTIDIRVRAVREGGMAITAVANAYRANRSTIHRWLSRFDTAGRHGLERRPVSGRPRKLAHVEADELVAIVLAPASAFGYESDFWTTRRLIQVMGSRFGVAVSKR